MGGFLKDKLGFAIATPDVAELERLVGTNKKKVANESVELSVRSSVLVSEASGKDKPKKFPPINKKLKAFIKDNEYDLLLGHSGINQETAFSYYANTGITIWDVKAKDWIAYKPGMPLFYKDKSYTFHSDTGAKSKAFKPPKAYVGLSSKKPIKDQLIELGLEKPEQQAAKSKKSSPKSDYYDKVDKEEKKKQTLTADLPKGPMGKVLFGNERQDKLRGTEDNTNLERNLLWDIVNHLNGHNKISPENGNKIINYLSKGLYPDILTKPAEPVVYRGLTVSVAALERILKKNSESLTFHGKLKFKSPMVYKPRGADDFSSSWSTNPSVSINFFDAVGDGPDFDGPIVKVFLVASTAENENRFFDLKKYYKVISDEFDREKEVIGLGDIKIRGIVWKTAGTEKKLKKSEISQVVPKKSEIKKKAA
jgi:hypothetical protein